MNRIEGKNIYLRKLTLKDVTSKYLSWLNDSRVNKYLESRFVKHTLNSLKKYIQSHNQPGSGSKMLGIFLSDGTHIGNVKIGEINRYHHHANIGIMIGETQHWGKGYATEASILATNYAFNELKLHKLVAGASIQNVGSFKSFKKAGFSLIGTYKKHRLYGQFYVDEVLLERIKTHK